MSLTRSTHIKRRRWSGHLATVGLLGGMVVAGSSAAAETTLTVGVVDYHSDAQQFLKNSIIPGFEKLHPGVKIEFKTGNWHNWTAENATWYAAGEEPDVLQGGELYVGVWGMQGMIQPLDQFARGWSDLSDFPKVELDDATFRGKLYDIPYELDQRILAYRKDLFAQAGLDPNAPPTTWDQIVADAKKLSIKDATGQWVQAGFNVPTNVQVYTVFLYEAGGSFLSADGRHVTVDTPQAREAAEFMYDLVQKYDVSPVGGLGGMKKGKIAMDISNYADMLINQKSNGIANDAIGISLPPRGPVNRSGATFINKWFIGSQTKHPELAWDWIKYLSEPDNMAKIAAYTRQVPPRLAMLNYSPWSSDPRWKTFFQAATRSTAFKTGVPFLSDLMNSKDYLKPALTNILSGETAPSVALADVQKRAQVALDEAWSKLEK